VPQFILGDTGNAIGIRVQHAYRNRGAVVKKRPDSSLAPDPRTKGLREGGEND
jgi:hypothetical protein